MENTNHPFCICTICGIRNTKDNHESRCINGHDSWLDLHDIISAQPLMIAMEATGLSAFELKDSFMNPEVKQIKIINPLQI